MTETPTLHDAWAKAAHEQMWHSRYEVPDPPTRAGDQL